jgi:hypothetical protein
MSRRTGIRIHPVHQHFLGVQSADRSRHRKHAIPSSRVRRYEGDFGAGLHDRGSLRRDSRERSAVLERTSPEVHAQAVSVIVDAIGDVWILVIAAGALWTICSVCLRRARFPTIKADEVSR